MTTKCPKCKTATRKINVGFSSSILVNYCDFCKEEVSDIEIVSDFNFDEDLIQTFERLLKDSNKKQFLDPLTGMPYQDDDEETDTDFD